MKFSPRPLLMWHRSLPAAGLLRKKHRNCQVHPSVRIKLFGGWRIWRTQNFAFWAARRSYFCSGCYRGVISLGLPAALTCNGALKDSTPTSKAHARRMLRGSCFAVTYAQKYPWFQRAYFYTATRQQWRQYREPIRWRTLSGAFHHIGAETFIATSQSA